MSVMHVNAVPRPAGCATEVIAGEDSFPFSGEVIPRMLAGAIALRAEAGDRGGSLAAGAEQGFLAESRVAAHPDAFLRSGEG
jgi:hypothetical protein